MGNIDIDINNIFFYLNRGSVHLSIHVYSPVPVSTIILSLVVSIFYSDYYLGTLHICTLYPLNFWRKCYLEGINNNKTNPHLSLCSTINIPVWKANRRYCSCSVLADVDQLYFVRYLFYLPFVIFIFLLPSVLHLSRLTLNPFSFSSLYLDARQNRRSTRPPIAWAFY